MEISKHAAVRMQSRGVPLPVMASIIENADIELDVGDGAVLYRVSRRQADRLPFRDKVRRYGVIASADGVVITVMPVRNRRRGR